MTQVTKQKFAIDENRVFLFTQQEGSVVDALPPAYYQIKEHPMMGLYLVNKGTKLPVPAELYGSTEKRATKILETYNRKEQGVGVALFGSKGAGKTLLSNVIANKALEQGLPVIDISGTSHISSELLGFINAIGDCVLIFDEFLKALSKVNPDSGSDDPYAVSRMKTSQAQDQLLTFFSGTNNAKRLTILIDNERHLLNEYFRDRPSRLRYIFNYTSVEADVVRQLANKHNLPSKLTDELVTYSAQKGCTFDMINELLDEIVHETDVQNVSLPAITRHFNVPTQLETKERKVRVSDFIPSPKEEDDAFTYALVNEVAVEMGASTYIAVSVTPTWDVNAVPEAKDENEYENAYSYDLYFTYEDYVESFKNKKLPVKEANFSLDMSCLLSIKGMTTTYRTSFGTVSIVDDIEPKLFNEFDYI